MLSAVVLKLQALDSGQIEGGTGRGVHGYWFHRWKEVDPGLADRLHAAEQNPPYTLSPLMGLRRPRRGVLPVSAGDAAWLRAAVLTRDWSEALLGRWAPPLEAACEIAGLHWRVEAVLTQARQHPWAGQEEYMRLARARLISSRPPEAWTLRFETPTSFHGGKGDLPFPLPDSLVGSWLRRWQAFAPLGMPDDLAGRVREQVVVSAYELKTAPVRYAQRLEVGCVGSLRLRALDLHPAERAAIDALAAFAFYCGSGRHTTQGMGMTRLEEREAT